MGQHVDELTVLGILWPKNVDIFTHVLRRTQFQLIIFGGITTILLSSDNTLWILIQTIISGSEHHILLRQSK